MTHRPTFKPPFPGAWFAVADHLAHLGVHAVFGLPGDDMDLLAALEESNTTVVLCRDQRNALYMATGHALAQGSPAVCVVGKGPALTNALTGLLEARSAAAPVVLLAGGTALDRLGTGAFQELDQLAAVRPFVKRAERVDRPEQLPAALERAVATAVNGTPGPVYLEIAEQIGAQGIPRPVAWRDSRPQRLAPDEEVLRASAERIAAARRPLLLVGGGARHRNEGGAIERFAELLGAPVFVTASGRGTVAEDHPLYCGVSGLYAQEPVARLWHRADLVVALGSRLEETATFGWPERDALPVIQVVAGEDSVVTASPGLNVLGDVARTVAGWTAALATCPGARDWAELVREARSELFEAAAKRAEQARLTVPEGAVTVARVLEAIDRAVPEDRILVQENGLQDMWSYFYPHWTCRSAGGSIVPSEQTPLGFGVAAAFGAALAEPERPVVALAGDGAFNVFRGELPTLAEIPAPVLYVVLDNGGYGWLQSNLERVCGSHSRFAFAAADRATGTAGQARDLGLWYRRVERAEELDEVLTAAWIECSVGRTAVVEAAVTLGDRPPGVDEPDGDFPSPAQQQTNQG
ncbi:thiamine pyrophosphate-binding protein [Kitasatospora cathayae]|uniref:Thiamine pyrophosphate-binding protein n=1 Tax=Kitasatospora cathayae TaxID=3004092 RepID=A0ABY7PWJ1_9ACTN|nr:thiamine pyrophosphate-binding protein [Kitasatospora sp. HUAS 3-15]WBP84768.1 thiamine pyrophosphate-binding protein [Kitasatospora sp. HUAS 3-15]